MITQIETGDNMHAPTITLPNGYDRSKVAEMMTFRNPIDIDEMDRHCTRNHRIWFAAADGTARQCTVNGRVRRWKRDRSRIEVPVKYGLYEYATLYTRDITRVLIPVEGGSHV